MNNLKNWSFQTVPINNLNGHSLASLLIHTTFDNSKGPSIGNYGYE